MIMAELANKPSVSELDELVIRRLHVLELAERLGNVSEACRRTGMDRTSFYDWRHRYVELGLDGLRDLPPAHRGHPQATPEAVVDGIVELSLHNPSLGCNKLEALLAADGRRLSAITIQKILNARGLGTRRQRWLALDTAERAREGRYSAAQLAFLAKQNPAIRERGRMPTRPGAQLVADTILVATLGGRQRAYLHAVIDCYGALAFGDVQLSKQPARALAVLRETVLPFYQGLGVRIATLSTDGGREFCGSRGHPYGAFLASADIVHHRLAAGAPHANGVMAKFQMAVAAEFVSGSLSATGCGTIDAVRDALKAWLNAYNVHRPNPGFANFGRPPAELVRSFVRCRRAG